MFVIVQNPSLLENSSQGIQTANTPMNGLISVTWAAIKLSPLIVLGHTTTRLSTKNRNLNARGLDVLRSTLLHFIWRNILRNLMGLFCRLLGKYRNLINSLGNFLGFVLKTGVVGAEFRCFYFYRIS